MCLIISSASCLLMYLTMLCTSGGVDVAVLQETAVAGDLAAAQAAQNQEELQSDGSSSSSLSFHDSPDSQSVSHAQQESPFSAHQAESPVGIDPSWAHLRLAGPKTPLSPQPSRPSRPLLTRQLSKSAPSSPQHPSHNSACSTSGNFKPASSDARDVTQGRTANIDVPGRAAQEGTDDLAGGSAEGSLGPLDGVSYPDGYMADNELASSRHRLHHSSVSFSNSGIACHQHHVYVVTVVLLRLHQQLRFSNGSLCQPAHSLCLL